MKILLPVLALILIAVASAFLPARPYLDFQVIYHAGLALLRGISLYDHPGQVNLIAGLAGVPPNEVFVLPFPYPPWYALSTFWLALLPINLAARTWLAISLMLLAVSMRLLTTDQRPATRLGFLVASLFWLPVLGSVFVGQFGFPVLLGATLMIHSLQQQKVVSTALASALLTFKPHLGGVVLLLAIIVLARRRDQFGNAALRGLLAMGVLLFGLGYLASPGWPSAYVHSLTGFREVSRCQLCVSTPMLLAGLFGGGLDQAMWISLALLGLIAAWLVIECRNLISEPFSAVAVGILITMLASPYLQSYDYMLLLVPFIEIARRSRGILQRSVMLLAFIVPLLGIALWGITGNVLLIASTCLLFLLTAPSWGRDGSMRAAGT